MNSLIIDSTRYEYLRASLASVISVLDLVIVVGETEFTVRKNRHTGKTGSWPRHMLPWWVRNNVPQASHGDLLKVAA